MATKWQVFTDIYNYQKIQKKKQGQARCKGQNATKKEQKNPQSQKDLYWMEKSVFHVKRNELLLSYSIHSLSLS